MSTQDNNPSYKFLAHFYDIFDLIFFLGGKGSPRLGLLQVIPNDPLKILDVCVGTASSSIVVASHCDQAHILGIDISEEMLSAAQKKITQMKLANLELRRMPAEALEFTNNTFDLVMVSFALHEFEQEFRAQVFQEVSRVLKPGGRFCVIDFARQAGAVNHLFIQIWGLMEPACFAGFLAMDWHKQLACYDLAFESETEYSFSKLYVLRKTGLPHPG